MRVNNKLTCNKCGHTRFGVSDTPDRLVSAVPHIYEKHYKCLSCGYVIAVRRHGERVHAVDYADEQEEPYDVDDSKYVGRHSYTDYDGGLDPDF